MPRDAAVTPPPRRTASAETTVTDGRRLRGQATRERAIEAASELFASQGYSATSMAMIAKAADGHAASLYHAFGSKEGLLAAVVERAADEFFAQIEAAEIVGDPVRAIEKLAVPFDSSPLFLRLLLVLLLERRDGDPALIETSVAVRERARAMMRRTLAPLLPDMPAQESERILDDMSRLLMMLTDGAFIARQVDAEGERFERLFALIGMAMRGLLSELLAQPGTLPR